MAALRQAGWAHSPTGSARWASTPTLLFIALLLGACAVSAARGEVIALSGTVQTLEAVTPIRHDVSPEYHVKRAGKPPVIDGKLDEWKDIPAITLDKREFVRGGVWNGQRDLMGSMKMLWDDKGMYFALDVDDDVVVEGDRLLKSQSLWQSDACQIVFDTLLNGRESKYCNQDTNYVIGRDSQGAVIGFYGQRHAAGGGRGGGNGAYEGKLEERNVQFAKRAGPPSGYVYEWFLSWEQLPFCSPYLLGRCGFNFSINDDDGNGFKSAMAWTKGLMYGFDPGKYGQIVFDDAPARDSVLLLPPGSGSEHQFSELNRWLDVKDLRSLKAAGVVMHAVKEQTATAGIKVYYRDAEGAEGKEEVYASGRVGKAMKAGESALARWDLSTLPIGNYQVVYETSLVPPLPPAKEPARAVRQGGLAFEQVEEPVEPAPNPPWVSGYRVRYPIDVLGGDMRQSPSKTIIVKIPSGGWLKSDGSDVLVQTADGNTLAAAVLSHDPRGDTILQFRRNGDDRWYWVYASNPDAPAANPALDQKVAEAKAAADATMAAKMTASKAAADRAAELRDLNETVSKGAITSTAAAAELAEWAKLLPEREAAVTATTSKLAAAQEAAAQATAALAPLQKTAREKTAAAKEAAKAAAEARQTADAATKANDAKAGALDAAAKEKEGAMKAAEDAAEAARLAAAPSAAAKASADQALALLTATLKQSNHSLAEAKKRVGEATALKMTTDAAITNARAKMGAAETSAAAARTSAEKAAVDAQAKYDVFMKMAGDADPRVYQEGLTAEFRQWAGDELSSWAVVAEGLKKSETVIGNAIVGEVMQNVNPFRQNDPRNFAAAYRGFLKVDRPGVYNFYANGDDAAFIFIDGYRVYSRTGSNTALGATPIQVFKVGSTIQLDAGIHPIEVYHVMGNSPGAQGMCGLMWLQPGARHWEYVTRKNLPQALIAVPARVEAFDGAAVATFEYGIDDALASDGVTLDLALFGAAGRDISPDALLWNFGDGTEAHGLTPTHVFFGDGDYEISLQSHPKLPPFKRRCHMWPGVAQTSPLGLGKAVEALAAMEVAKLDVLKLNDALQFLQRCQQPTRWAVMEKVCRALLEHKDVDLAYRAELYGALMQAIARQGRGEEALKLVEPALAEVAQVRTLRARVLLAAAEVNRDALKDFPAAGKLFEQIIEENRRLRHPVVRQAAVEWGDLYADAGQLPKAAECYRMARGLGAVGQAGESTGEPVKRGALLRVAEQQLKEGNIRQTARLLQKIEMEFPEQKIEGLYRFLRAESERNAGQLEEALRDYEVLLHLRQWSSFRASAVYGTADVYYRMGDYANAMKWVSTLQESYPDFFAQRKLQQYRAGIEARLTAASAAGKEPLFKDYSCGFEASDAPLPPLTTTDAGALRVRPSTGIDGLRTVFVDARNPQNVQIRLAAVQNIPSEGSLWVELWYRDQLANPIHYEQRSMNVDLMAADGTKVGTGVAQIDRTFGQWMKAAVKLPVPATSDVDVIISINGMSGLLELDGLRVAHVSDGQDTALTRFIEGANPQ